MTLRETPTIVTPTGVGSLQFKDEADTVNTLIPLLRERGVAAIVVLLHQGGAQLAQPPGRQHLCWRSRRSPIKAIVGRLDDTVAW